MPDTGKPSPELPFFDCKKKAVRYGWHRTAIAKDMRMASPEWQDALWYDHHTTKEGPGSSDTSRIYIGGKSGTGRRAGGHAEAVGGSAAVRGEGRVQVGA